jgi:hypothetical protein
LPELSLEGSQVKPELGPTAAINLLEQPTAIAIQLLEQIVHAGRRWIWHQAHGCGSPS